MLNLTPLKSTAAAILASAGLIANCAAEPTEFSAGTVMEEMDPAQRYVFVSGIVEGIAYARWKADGKDKGGMECIYDWFYGEGEFENAPDAIDQIEEAFLRYKTLIPGAVVGALTELRCPV